MQRVMVVLMLMCVSVHADYFHAPARGWHWNNVPVKKHATAHKLKPIVIPADPQKRALQFQHALLEAKAAWMANPTWGNDERFMALQHIAQEKATRATDSMMQFIALNPRYNEGLVNPTNSASQKADLNYRLRQQKAFARALAKHFGIFYFYQGHKPQDVVNAKMVTLFANLYGYALVGIPVDGIPTSVIQDNKPDTGQAAHLGVKATPAIMLVNPTTRGVIPLLYGYASTSQLLSALEQRLGVNHD